MWCKASVVRGIDHIRQLSLPRPSWCVERTIAPSYTKPETGMAIRRWQHVTPIAAKDTPARSVTRRTPTTTPAISPPLRDAHILFGDLITMLKTKLSSVATSRAVARACQTNPMTLTPMETLCLHDRWRHCGANGAKSSRGATAGTRVHRDLRQRHTLRPLRNHGDASARAAADNSSRILATTRAATAGKTCNERRGSQCLPSELQRTGLQGLDRLQ